MTSGGPAGWSSSFPGVLSFSVEMPILDGTVVDGDVGGAISWTKAGGLGIAIP